MTEPTLKREQSISTCAVSNITTADDVRQLLLNPDVSELLSADETYPDYVRNALQRAACDGGTAWCDALKQWHKQLTEAELPGGDMAPHRLRERREALKLSMWDVVVLLNNPRFDSDTVMRCEVPGSTYKEWRRVYGTFLTAQEQLHATSETWHARLLRLAAAVLAAEETHDAAATALARATEEVRAARAVHEDAHNLRMAALKAFRVAATPVAIVEASKQPHT